MNLRYKINNILSEICGGIFKGFVMNDPTENFKCSDCGGTDCELEQDYDDDELLAEDLVCDDCGHVDRLY